MLAEPLKQWWITVKAYEDGTFKGAFQWTLSPGVDPEMVIDQVNQERERLYYSGLRPSLVKLELFATVGV